MRAAFFVSVLGLVAAACSSSGSHGPGEPGLGSGAGSGSSGAGTNGFGNSNGNGVGGALGGLSDGGIGTSNIPACVGLQCQQHACAGGGSTTISGRVYDPAGKNPLYNIVVYVPNAPLEPLKTGASCDQCDTLYSGHPVASALTDADGNFKITDAPDGTDIPLVIQVGKWRKELKIAKVTRCKDNPQPDKSLRLPKNHKEGAIPNIAISTGGADTLECLLRRIGVDASEYTPGPGGAGRIHIFHGGGRLDGVPAYSAPNTSPPAPEAPVALWDKKADLMRFDIVLLSCEGAETTGMNQAALHAYASAGGRVFASHFHYAWFNTGPYGSENLATWTTGSNHIDDINATIVTKLPNGKTFPKGVALEKWLGNVNALTNGELPIKEARHNADLAPGSSPSQTWILADSSSPAPGAVQYLSFNTPTDAKITPDGPSYCGRVVYSDLHVGAASGDMPIKPVPDECAKMDLSPQEKALEFMLFDLSSCVTPDSKPPAAPVVEVPQ